MELSRLNSDNFYKWVKVNDAWYYADLFNAEQYISQKYLYLHLRGWRISPSVHKVTNEYARWEGINENLETENYF